MLMAKFIRTLSRLACEGTWVAALVAAAAALAPASAAPQSTVTINVPKRTPAAPVEIGALKITLQLDSSNPIAIQVSGPHGNRATGSMVLTNAADDCFPLVSPIVCFTDFNNPGGGLGTDTLIMRKPQQLAPNDPAFATNDKLVLLLQLLSNSNESANCISTMPGDETWTVSVVGGLPRITGIAVENLDRNTLPSCSTHYRPIPANDPPVAQVTSPAPVLPSGRVGLDAVLVLDRSGSMASGTTASPTPTKIERLHQVTGMFLDMWHTLRSNESSQLIDSPQDRVGFVYFDHEAKWLSSALTEKASPPPTATGAGLTDFATLDANLMQEKTAINFVDPRGSTSIGCGLRLGASVLPPGNNRRAILLMTDGLQNTDPMVQVFGSQVQTALTGGTVCASPGATGTLTNQPFQIYTVSVGTDVAIPSTILHDIAVATNGLNFNTQVDSPADNTNLVNAFMAVLQNFIKYSTVESLRVIADTTRFKAPFKTLVPVTSSTKSLAFSLVWNGRDGNLRVLLTPPGGGSPITFTSTLNAGTITGGVKIPLPNDVNAEGLWTIEIATDNDSKRPIAFNFNLLGDDAAISSALGFVAREYRVGDKIKLTAQVNDFGRRLVDIEGKPNGRVQAIVVRPGSNLGDVLSDATINPAPPGPGDQSSAAQRKLQALLAEKPDVLTSKAGVINLKDDGDAANGDNKADDGIYSALVPADIEGHYSIVFFVEGESKSGGAFVRQQIRTVHVRSLPDPKATTYQTSVSGSGSQRVFVVNITPRNLRGGRMGPGWANYFWFIGGPKGPVKGVDNLNGSFTARIPFSGSRPPRVSVRFIADPVFLPDEVRGSKKYLQSDLLKRAVVVVADVSKGGKK